MCLAIAIRSISNLNRFFTRFIAMLIAYMVVSISPVLAQESVTEAKVTLFSPQGTSRNIRQVTARFTTPMTTLGDPRHDNPFDIECAPKGKGRWADGKTWVYDFDANLPAGISCKFTLQKNLSTLNGEKVSGQRSYSFNTGGPAVVAQMPGRYNSIDENQAFILGFDAEVNAKSLVENVYCAVDGIQERIPVKRLTVSQRSELLAGLNENDYYLRQLLTRVGSWDANSGLDKKWQENPLIEIVKCGRTLPAGHGMRLIVDKGLLSSSGIPSIIQRSFDYTTRPTFTAHMSCERSNARAGCLPIRPVQLQFSAPVALEVMREIELHLPNGDVVKPDGLEKSEQPFLNYVTFKGLFPPSSKLSITLPNTLLDDSGRQLDNAKSFPLEFATDEAPALAKFSGSFGILEADEGGILPLTLRNIGEQDKGDKLAVKGRILDASLSDRDVARWLKAVEEAERYDGHREETKNGYIWVSDTGAKSILKSASAAKDISIPLSEDDHETAVVGVPLGKPGFYIIELESPRLGAALLGDERPRYVSTAALVTNMSVHFKWGSESSLVWVTSLSSGESVDGATITISNRCSGSILWSGRTNSEGRVLVSESLGTPSQYGWCNTYSSTPILMVSARNDNDFSFTQSNWTDGIAPSNFNLPTSGIWQKVTAHTVFDRTLFRAGETVSMKHIVRKRISSGFGSPVKSGTKIEYRVIHQGTYTRYTGHVIFDQSGASTLSWQIPKGAHLGNYSVELQIDDMWKSTGSFKVQEFRLPTMKGSVSGPKPHQVRPSSIPLDLYLGYISGGGAMGQSVKLRTVIEPTTPSTANYEDFSFDGRKIIAGIQDNKNISQPADRLLQSRVTPLTLDKNGAMRSVIKDLPKLDGPARLSAEMEYADANGEIQTIAGSVPLWPSNFRIGIRREGWVATEEQLRFRAVVLDLQGKAVTDQNVKVSLFKRTNYSYRKRLVGGFYAYENVQDISLLDTQCDGETNEQGLLLCDIEPGTSGQIILQAEATDDDGNSVYATTSVWVVGEDEWWFGGTAGDRMDVLPEQKEYEAGDIARFQVRMPFRDATALVTIEREGILDSFVTEISGESPVVEIPIKDNYAPNIFVSVLAVRGRVSGYRSWLAEQARDYDLPLLSKDGGLPTASIDLSKPAYKLGMAKVRVGWAPYKLDVKVSADKQAYDIRSTARVNVEVKPPKGQKLPKGAEVAIAVVDEALLELSNNRSWDILSAMMGERGLEVFTSTAQMQVVGKRHYGRKAVPQGGGGGRERARELFDTLLLWQGTVSLDDNGEAVIDVPLNDSLTAFKIVAIGTAGDKLFGTGYASIRTKQDVIAISGLPPVVREGDRFDATFSVRNTTNKTMTIDVAATVSDVRKLTPQKVIIEAGSAKDVTWSIYVPHDLTSLDWTFKAKDGDSGKQDSLKVSQEVTPAYPVRTYQATMAQISGKLITPVERPHDAIVGRGGIELTLQSTLGGSLDGVVEYMQRYPYICLEQKTSKAISLDNHAVWQGIMSELPAYLDRDGLAKYFKSGWLEGSDTLTAYVLTIANERGWKIPQDAQTKMIRGLSAFVQGRITRRSYYRADDLLPRKLAAIAALARYDAATTSMIDSITIDPGLWPTSAVLDWIDILKRMKAIKSRDNHLTTAKNTLRARLNFQGTVMSFSSEKSDYLWWLMASGDVNSVRALSSLSGEADWQEDIGRLARGALSRLKRGHWQTTVANTWGILAFKKFSALYEKDTVTGSTIAALANDKKTHNWAKEQVSTQTFPWSEGKQGFIIEHDGGGKPWALIRAQAALPLKESLSSGYKITKTITPLDQKVAGVWSRGDLVRVKLELDAQSDMTWVVVDDPIPAGATILGSGLGRDSAMSTSSESKTGRVWLAYEERSFQAYRAYYQYVAKGKWSTEYTVRLNNPGVFLLPATRVEAMYAPEMFGESPNATMEVMAVK